MARKGVAEEIAERVGEQAAVNLEQDVESESDFRLTVTIPVPADVFRQAEMISALRGPIEALRKQFPGASVEHSVSRRRKRGSPVVQEVAALTPLEQAIAEAA